MEFFCGLDVGMDETAICVVDDKGEVALQVTVVTDPDAVKAALKPYLGRLRRVGHEAGTLSPWLHPELLKLGLPAICLETQHVRAAMSAQRNKTDKAREFSLVPWRPVLERATGQSVSGIVGGEGISWSIGQKRGLGR
jgi:transposase